MVNKCWHFRQHIDTLCNCIALKNIIATLEKLIVLRLWGVERVYPSDFTPRKAKHPQAWKVLILTPQYAHISDFLIWCKGLKKKKIWAFWGVKMKTFQACRCFAFLGVKSLGYTLSTTHNIKASVSVIFQFLTLPFIWSI